MADLESQIAALQAQLQDLLAQQALAAGEDAGEDAGEATAEATADLSMQEAVAERLRMTAPDPMEGDYEAMLAEDAAAAEPAPAEPAPDLAEELGYPLDPQLEAAIDADIAAAAAPAAAEAVAVPVEEDEEALRLFSVAHGGPFDPQSSMDAGKMDTLRKLLAAQGGLGDMSDTQFALQLYRQ